MESISTAAIILFTIALIMGRSKALSDYVLISWFCLFLFNVAGFYILDTTTFPFSGCKKDLLQLSDALVFLHGPMFLFYTLALTRHHFVFRWFYLLHLLPFAVALSLMVGDHYYSQSPYVPLVETLLKITLLLLYIIPVYRQLLKHRRNVKNIFSNAEQKYLGWLFILSNGILLLWTVLFVVTLINIAGTMGHLTYDGRVLKVTTDTFLIFMCYFGVRQPALYNTIEPVVHAVEQVDSFDFDEEVRPIEEQEQTTPKYQKSGLTQERIEDIHKRLLGLMDATKPYLDDNLTLFSLAEQVQVLPNHLSQVINLREGKNFFDFVNYYRVEEFKRIIQTNQMRHFTLLGIAFECGFNSKAAFNRAFKKFTGQTPSEFKANC